MTLPQDVLVLPYRACVGVALLNREGLVFVGRRIDTPGDAWQMPQGGIDAGESPREAAFRELREEVGTDRAELLAESRHWYSYDLPPEIARRMRVRGQRQRWFALRFTGDNREIDLAAHGDHAEFSDWRWVELERLPDLVVPFKRAVYEQVVREFRDRLGGG